MVSPTRFDSDDDGVMFPHSDGDWCEYEYKGAVDEIDRLTAEVEAKDKKIAGLEAYNERLTDEFGDLRDENERLTAWLRHLTARVEALQEKDDE